MRTRPIPAVLGALAAGGAGAAGLLVFASATPEKWRAQDPASGLARALHASAALLAVSALADSVMEHYRGSFGNPGMYAPLLGATMALAAGTSGAASRSAGGDAFRQGSYALATTVGAAGLAFHLYNIVRRPGGFGWLNLFYGAPIGAPAALSVCGMIGLVANSIQMKSPRGALIWGVPAGRALAGLSAIALMGTVAEAALFHFRGAFQNPFMWAPVTVPAVAAGLMAKACGEAPVKRHPLTRLWLSVMLTLGWIGVGFHACGVSRAKGGWRNWSQNLIDGPPLSAPPSFSALALTSLAALSLIEKDAGGQDEQN